MNNEPPRFAYLNAPIQVSHGGSVPLGRQVLGVVDPDTSVEDLRFTLKVMPNHGQMEKILDNNRIFLRQGKGKPNFVVCAFLCPFCCVWFFYDLVHQNFNFGHSF